MVIWINGAFGAGKTQTAYELHRRLPGSYVYDPENVGYFIRENLPAAMEKGDFQDYPMWRAFNLAMLDYIAAHHTGDIIVPMTITKKQYYDELVGALSQKYKVKHFILYAQKRTLLKRLAARLEGRRSWAARQIDRCIKAFDEDIVETKIHTDHMKIDQVVERIAVLSGLMLTEDGRSRLRRLADRAATQIRHIR